MGTKNGLILREILLAVLLLVALAAAADSLNWRCDCGRTRSIQGRLFCDLQTVRSQILLYTLQHDHRPGTIAGVSFERAMTRGTNRCGSLNPGNPYGPYLTRIPVNSRNGLDSIEIDGHLGGGDHGWHYETKTGQFHPDTDQDINL